MNMIGMQTLDCLRSHQADIILRNDTSGSLTSDIEDDRFGNPASLSTGACVSVDGLGVDARGVRDDCGLGGKPVLEWALRKLAERGRGASSSLYKKDVYTIIAY